MGRKQKDYSGQRFGMLVAIEPTQERKPHGNNVIWLCRCDCGNYVKVSTSEFRNGAHTVSCGCYRNALLSEKSKTHGHSKERLYTIWINMRRRCYDPNAKGYKNYGGRGIQVCERFNDYEYFREWAIGSGYDEFAKTGACTIDRIDGNGDYSPENCRWVSMKFQQNNKRNNVRLTHNGETKTASQWEDIMGYRRGLILDRIRRGWDVCRAIDTPPLK